jgi:tRNA threonylcarbamoyladenosine biosynthesis protein TsaB
MIVLGLDTATAQTAVGLLGPGSDARERSDGPDERGRPRHTTRLLALAQELLVEAGLDWTDLERIAVGLGPGTFTGLRIGVATARGLAQVTGASLVGLSTLRVLAAAAATPQTPAVLSVVDARRGEAYAATHIDGQLLEGPLALTPEGLLELARTPPPGDQARWVAVGDGALRFREHLRTAELIIPPEDSSLHRVSARVLCELAAGERGQEPEDLVPDYVRRPDAELTASPRSPTS